jgi:uncharacterized protein YmfQ (DUF2313 family)
MGSSSREKHRHSSSSSHKRKRDEHEHSSSKRSKSGEGDSHRHSSSSRSSNRDRDGHRSSSSSSHKRKRDDNDDGDFPAEYRDLLKGGTDRDFYDEDEEQDLIIQQKMKQAKRAKFTIPELDKFDPDTMKPMSSLLVVGKRWTCKSTTVRNFLPSLSGKDIKARDPETGKRYKPMRRSVVFCSTEKYAHEWEKTCGIDPKDCHYELTIAKVERYVKEQKMLAEMYGSNNPEYGLQIIIDDFGFDRRILSHKVIADIMSNGRWFNTVLIIIVQEAIAVPKQFRNQFDVIIATREFTTEGQNDLRRWYFGAIRDGRTFAEVIEKYTENYGVLVNVNNSQKNKVTDVYFWYRGKKGFEPKRSLNWYKNPLKIEKYIAKFKEFSKRKAEKERRRRHGGSDKHGRK